MLSRLSSIIWDSEFESENLYLADIFKFIINIQNTVNIIGVAKCPIIKYYKAELIKRFPYFGS